MLTVQHTEKAYAKINLYLDMVGKRDNGYHDILSIMQNISLCDTVTLDVSFEDSTEIIVGCDAPDIPVGSANIAYLAVQAFLERTRRTAHVSVYIEKNIPSAAGMAGGSADAAAVLRGLNKIFDSPLTLDELCDIGAKIGADVPFCIVGGTCITEGIGERLEVCVGLNRNSIILAARGGEGVSTPAAYRDLDIMYNDFKKRTCDRKKFEVLISALKENDTDAVYGTMYNIFEDVVLGGHSLAGRLKSEMYACGAEFVMMSGSGPSIFGIFADLDSAKKAKSVVDAFGNVKSYICNPL
jgi:4-diphosphocytidyl-2-C-methyl-D-erythritol kinase